jgi:hypothetical protein
MGVPSIQQFLQSAQHDGHDAHELAQGDAHDNEHDHESEPLAASGKRGRE